MPSKGTTTVVLTESAQQIKEELAPVFGLKNILSAGLLLLDNLSDSDMVSIIGEANGLESSGIDLWNERQICQQIKERLNYWEKESEKANLVGGDLDYTDFFSELHDILTNNISIDKRFNVKTLKNIIEQILPKLIANYFAKILPKKPTKASSKTLVEFEKCLFEAIVSSAQKPVSKRKQKDHQRISSKSG